MASSFARTEPAVRPRRPATGPAFRLGLRQGKAAVRRAAFTAYAVGVATAVVCTLALITLF